MFCFVCALLVVRSASLTTLPSSVATRTAAGIAIVNIRTPSMAKPFWFKVLRRDDRRGLKESWESITAPLSQVWLDKLLFHTFKREVSLQQVIIQSLQCIPRLYILRRIR